MTPLHQAAHVAFVLVVLVGAWVCVKAWVLVASVGRDLRQIERELLDSSTVRTCEVALVRLDYIRSKTNVGAADVDRLRRLAVMLIAKRQDAEEVQPPAVRCCTSPARGA